MPINKYDKPWITTHGLIGNILGGILSSAGPSNPPGPLGVIPSFGNYATSKGTEPTYDKSFMWFLVPSNLIIPYVAPFYKTDWPTTQPPVYTVSYIHGKPPLEFAETTPFNQTKWALTQLPVDSKQQGWIYSEVPSRITPHEPFHKLDWPLTQGPVYSTKGFVQGIEVETIIPYDPFSKNAWPLTQPTTYPISYVQGLMPTYLLPYPFSQTQWALTQTIFPNSYVQGQIPSNIPLPFCSTTWNPNDKTSNETLSNGNLTVVGTTDNADGAVRALVARSSGKYYYEYNNVSWTVFDNGGGIATAAANLSNCGNTALQVSECYTGGSIWVNGSNVGSLSSGIGNSLEVAVDIDNNAIWFRTQGGTWNGSSSNHPDTNVGGKDISSLTASGIYPLVTNSNSTTNTTTANFGGSAFAYAVPPGFTAGWPCTAQISIDAGSKGTGKLTTPVSSVSATIPSTIGNGMIMVVAHAQLGGADVQVSSVPNTTHLSGFTKRKQLLYQSGTGRRNTLEVWYTTSNTILSSEVVTVNFSAAPDEATVTVFCVNGATGWDTNGSLPASASDTTDTSNLGTVTGVSTDSTVGMLLGFIGSQNSGIFTASGTGFHDFNYILDNVGPGPGYSAQDTERMNFSSAQSNVTVNFNINAPEIWGMIVDSVH